MITTNDDAAAGLREGVEFETTSEERAAYQKYGHIRAGDFVDRLLRDFDRLSAEIKRREDVANENWQQLDDAERYLEEATAEIDALRAQLVTSAADKTAAVEAARAEEREACELLALRLRDAKRSLVNASMSRETANVLSVEAQVAHDIAAAIHARGGSHG